MAKTSNSDKSSDKGSGSNSGSKTGNTTSGAKSITSSDKNTGGSTAPASQKVSKPSSSSPAKNGNASLSGGSGGSTTTKSVDKVAPSSRATPVSTASRSSDKNISEKTSRADPAFSDGPSFVQFQDFLDSTRPRSSPAFSDGPSLSQFEDFLADGAQRAPRGFDPIGSIQDWWGEQQETHDANVTKRREAGEPVWTPDPVGDIGAWWNDQQATHDANVLKRQEETKANSLMGGLAPAYNSLTPAQRTALSSIEGVPAIREIAPPVWAPNGRGGSAGIDAGINANKTMERLAAAPAVAQPGRPAAGIDAAVPAIVEDPRFAVYEPPAAPPLPRSRPNMIPTSDGRMAYAPPADPMGGIEVTPTADQPMSDEAKYAAKYGRGNPEPSIWDNVVNGAGGVLGNTLVGGAVKKLFPEFWEEAGGGFRSLGERTDGARISSDVPQSIMSVGDGGSSNGYAVLDGYTTALGGAAQPSTGQVPAPVVPVPAAPVIDQYGNVVFPDMPPYNPGRDNEWQYYRGRQGYADGGIVHAYAQGGAVSPLANQDPRMEIIADAEDALEGHHPNPDAAIKLFVENFGEPALDKLRQQVEAGMTFRGKSRLVRGPGGPKDDAIPARLDNGEEARLSDGEFVMPAEAVLGAGEGDRDAGADKLTQLAEMLGSKDSGKTNVDRVA